MASIVTSEAIPLLTVHEHRAGSVKPISIQLRAVDRNGQVEVFFNLSEDVNFKVKKINVTSQNAKRIIFTIFKPNSEEKVPKEVPVQNSSVENNVMANFEDIVASKLLIQLIPATEENKPLDVSFTAIELEVCIERALPDRNGTSTSSSDSLGRGEKVKTFPVGKITDTSKDWEKFEIVCTLTKPNGEKLKKKETSEKKDDAVHTCTSFAGEIASSVQIEFFPSVESEIVSVNVFKISFQKDPLDKGELVFIGFGVIFLGVVIMMIVIHKIKWMNNYCQSELINIILFLISIVLGIVGFFILICLRCKIVCVRITTTEFTFSKAKLILLYIFGIGYMFHSGLYIWKHNFQEDCPGNSTLDIIYDSFSILYTCIIFVYFALFYDRKLERAVQHYYVLTPILVSNVCIWLNAISFGSDFLNKSIRNNENTSDNNVTESNLAVAAIEKADVFCLPAMVEFSLMAIDMLFTDNDYTIDDFSTRNLQLIEENKCCEKICHICRKCVQIFVSLVAIVFFAFVFTVVLTTSSSSNILHHSQYFLLYFCFELGMKSVMLLLIIIGIIIYTIMQVICINNSESVQKRLNRLLKHWLNNLVSALWKPSSYVLIITTIGNFVYHIIYCIALKSEYINIDIPSVSNNISFSVNIVSLFLAPLQLSMILAIRSKDFICTSSQEHQRLQCLHSTFMYYTCFILGVFNLALWASDSIGEDRRSVLSIVYHWSYKELKSSVLYTIVFPITVFFRFQTGMDFLEFYWENVFNAR